MAFDIRLFAETFFEPLIAATKSRVALKSLISELGVTPQFNEDQLELISAALGIAALAENVIEVVGGLTDGELSDSDIAAIMECSRDGSAQIKALSQIDTSQLAQLPAPFNDADFWQNLPAELLEYLLLNWLDCFVSPVYETMHFIGVVRETPRGGNLPPKRELDLDALAEFFSRPDRQIVARYDWEQAFLHGDFLLNLARMLDAFGLSPRVLPLRANWRELVRVNAETQPPLELSLDGSMLDRLIKGMSIDLALVPYRPSSASQVSGLALIASANSGFGTQGQFGAGPWGYDVGISAGVTAALGVAAQGVEPLGSIDAASVDAALRFEPDDPVILFGKADGTRLELEQFSLAGSLDLATSPPEIGLRAAIGNGADSGLRLVIGLGDGDNFLKGVLGSTQFEVPAGMGLGWNSGGKLEVEGGAGFEIERTFNLNVGPLQLNKVRVAIWAGTEGLDFTGAISGGFDIGVIAAVVEDVGLTANLAKAGPDDTPDIGPLNLKLGFKPPSGLGLAIDAGGVVSGGGYLFVDPDIGRYAGVAEVKIFVIGLSAIGIIETKMPDDEDGWSLFLAIFSEFPPIQLGFGFALIGVGGLIGLNRTIDEDELFGRLITGGLDSIMFPEDPVANAPRIIDDITAIFPAAQGQFLFGAMFKLGWSTPSIIEADIGLILEIPKPFRIVLLGQVAAYLPTPAKAAVVLHLDVAGVLNLTEGYFEMHAVLRDSHIAGVIHLSGGMAMKAVFEGRPEMILSIGGFHSNFEPPAGFRTPSRITAAIPVGKVADVTLSGFLAITSNTFQAGGRIDIYAKIIGFTIEGWLGMETLIQFSPFQFEVSIEFGVSIRKGSFTLAGLDVKARVLGPSPIEIFGTAEFKFLGFKKEIELHIETKGKKKTVTALENVAELITAALEAEGAIQCEVGGSQIVLVKDGGFVDPASRIVILQKIAPLGEEWKKFSAASIEGAPSVSIDTIRLNGAQLDQADIENELEWFARAQFYKMSDAKKLSSPSFEEFDAGVSIGSDAQVMPPALDVSEGFDEIVLGKTDEPEPRRRGKVNNASKTLCAHTRKLKTPRAVRPAFTVKRKPTPMKKTA